MSERKNIDRLFQEKFKDFEAEPSEQSWKNIEARLNKKKNRKVIPFWFKLSGIAAALLIGFFITDRRVSPENTDSTNGVVVSPGHVPGSGDTVKGSEVHSNKSAIATANEDKSGDSSPAVNDSGIADKDKGAIVTSSSIKSKDNKKGQGTIRPRSISGEPNEAVAVSKGKKNRKQGSVLNTGPISGKNTKIASGTKKAKGNTPFSANSETAVAQTQKNSNGASKNDRSANKIGTALPKDKNSGVAGTKVNQQNGSTPTETASQIASNNRKDAGTPVKDIESKVTEIKTQTQIVAAADEKKAEAKSKNDTTAVATVVPNALGELLNEKENKSVTESGQKINRWQVYTHVAPIYLSSASDGSSIDPALANNAKEYKTSLSYGAGVSYTLGKKLAIRAGVNSVTMEYSTNDIVYNQAFARQGLRNVDSNISGTMLEIQSAVAPPSPGASLINNNEKKFTGSLNQKTGYIEVPVELSYKLVDRKFGVDVVGGFSTLFLQQNEIALVSDGGQMEIGKANNLNSTHFSGNLGLGLKYSILKSLQFNVEPMLKYQINTYNSGDFKPFFFGLYTGLNYRF